MLTGKKLKALCAALLAATQLLGGQLSVGIIGATFSNEWVQVGNSWYYADRDGKYLTGWNKIGNIWYYFDGSGVMKTGWLEDSGKWYYLTSSGAMVTGWNEIGGKWYYFSDNGEMKTGWLSDGGKWYYLSSSGAMVKGWTQAGGKWYYMNRSGVMLTGWQTIGNKWYFFNASGVMQNGWVNVSGKWYFLSKDGSMKTGFVKEDLKTYYLDSSGAMVTGWKQIGKEWYFFEYGSGAAAEGWKKLGGYYYFFVRGEMAHDTYIGGWNIGTSGQLPGDKDPSDIEITSFNQVIELYRFETTGDIFDFGTIRPHISGYDDPDNCDSDCGTIVTSGATHVALTDFDKNETRFYKIEDFDEKAYLNGGYGTRVAADYCVIPGGKVTYKIRTSEEYCDFFGWSYSPDYDTENIISTKTSITVTAYPNEGFINAHVNSPWDSCYTDYQYNNSCTRSPQSCGVVYRLPCHRGENGEWLIDNESRNILSGVALYHWYSYSAHPYPDTYAPRYYDCFNRTEDYEIPVDKVTVEILIDDYGEEAEDEIYTIKYERVGERGYNVIMYDKEGNVRPTYTYWGDNKFMSTDPVTGEYTYFIDERRAARYN